MRFCPKCQVIVNHNDKNCPLCGRYCENDIAPDKYLEAYNEIDKVVHYPIINNKSQENFLRKRTFLILIVIMVSCVVINYLFSPDLLWYPYVIIGLLSAYISVFQTIFLKRRLYIQIQVNTLLCCIILFCIDFLATQLSGNVLLIGIPIVLGAAILTSNFLIIFSKKSHGYYIALTVSCIWGIIPQLVIWIFSIETSIVISILFLLSVVNFFIIMIFYPKRLIKEFQKRFFT